MTEDTTAFNDVPDRFSAASLAAQETRERALVANIDDQDQEDMEDEGLEDMENEDDELATSTSTPPTPANYVSPSSFHVN